MQIAIDNNNNVVAACNLEKRVHDIEGKHYYCIHCVVEVIPRIGERGLSHYAKHNEVLHKEGCPEIFLNSSVKLPSSNSKFLVGNKSRNAILKNISVINKEDILFKVEVKDLIFTPNNLPVFNNKQTYVVVTEVANVSGTVIGLGNGVKIITDNTEVLAKLKLGVKFMLLTPIMDKLAKGNKIESFYFYDDMSEEVKANFDLVMNK